MKDGYSKSLKRPGDESGRVKGGDEKIRLLTTVRQVERIRL